jgi:translation elongation factor P/translation initiation factor 5A
MEYLAIFVLGFFIGANYAANVIRKQIHNAAKEAGVLKEEPEIKVAPVLTLEKHGNTYYLFDKKTDTFLCQSNDINELGQKLVEYKDIKLAYVQDDENQVFWFVNGKVASSPQ